MDDTQPDDNTQLEGSNTIWSQLFWNGSPSQLAEPDVELARNAYADTVSACFQIEDYPGYREKGGYGSLLGLFTLALIVIYSSQSTANSSVQFFNLPASFS